MVASVWFSRWIFTPSLASTAWCSPSLQRRPGIRRPGELVDDDDFAVLDHVVLVEVEQHVGLEGLLHVVLPLDGVHVPQVGQVQQARGLVEAFVGQGHGAALLVDRVVAGEILFAGLLAFDHLAADEFGDDAVGLRVLVGRFLARAGDDERGAGFVDQDRVHFVDDAVVMVALDAILQAELHVVAQVVEAELVVGAVGDVAVVGLLALVVVEVVDDDADRHAQELVEPAHPLGVALGQVIVDGDDVDALARRARSGKPASVATSVFPSPVFISAILPWCSTMPPIN